MKIDKIKFSRKLTSFSIFIDTIKNSFSSTIHYLSFSLSHDINFQASQPSPSASPYLCRQRQRNVESENGEKGKEEIEKY